MVEQFSDQTESNPVSRDPTTHGSPPASLRSAFSSEPSTGNRTVVPEPGTTCLPENAISQASAANSSCTAISNNDSSRLLAVPMSDGPSTPPREATMLSIRTDHEATEETAPESQFESDIPLRTSLSSNGLSRRTSSRASSLLAAALPSHAGSVSPASVFSSPQLAALADITPLPSPIHGTSPWRSGSTHSLARSASGASHRGSTFSLKTLEPNRTPRATSGLLRAPDSVPTQDQSPTPDPTRIQVPRNTHSRNRSLSEYVPPALLVPGVVRSPVAGASGTVYFSNRTPQNQLQREEFLGIQRGITVPQTQLPTPPSTGRGEDGSEAGSPILSRSSLSSGHVYHVKSIRTQQPRTYRMIRQLGQGTFSQVTLAVREGLPHESSDRPSHPRLVAVKVVEYGPAGGADEERVEVSLKREVDILRSINHPSMIQLKAFGSDEKRALLVLDYCPGGDLFEFASKGPNALSPPAIRRIFAELVDAVRYLHENQIVHRDIKLENVLLNVTATAMQEITDWKTYPRAVVTLTDMGLSRRIPQPPESPLLHTRCGSEDYAAPEILMGQPYDGRSTDAWALGVLLYAMIENRLPFDPLPGTRGDPIKLRTRTPHRIARCEWHWCRYANEEGDWDPVKGAVFEAARTCVRGLLKRSSRRMSLDEIASSDWVGKAIDVPGGLKRGDYEVP